LSREVCGRPAGTPPPGDVSTTRDPPSLSDRVPALTGSRPQAGPGPGRICEAPCTTTALARPAYVRSIGLNLICRPRSEGIVPPRFTPRGGVRARRPLSLGACLATRARCDDDRAVRAGRPTLADGRRRAACVTHSSDAPGRSRAGCCRAWAAAPEFRQDASRLA